MTKALTFIKKESVFMIAFLFAILSMLVVPLDREYQNYIDISVLILLFCLMAVVGGMREIGLFSFLSQKFLTRLHDVRRLCLVLTGFCFFISMLITNDVALLTFVPLTLGLLEDSSEAIIIRIIAIETIAANLGSMLTPVGNPQNLFLYSYFNMTPYTFFATILPLGALCIPLVFGLSFLLPKGEKIKTEYVLEGKTPQKRDVFLWTFLFALCLLAVFKILNIFLLLGIVCIAVAFLDRSVFLKVDYILLFTFLSFFVFVGNMARIESVRSFLENIIFNHEMIVSALTSQVISNVPAAIMLSSFTKKGSLLLLGTNIGGLGTLVASLASLISYKLYSARSAAKRGAYLLFFSTLNFILLGILIGLVFLFGLYQ